MIEERETWEECGIQKLTHQWWGRVYHPPGSNPDSSNPSHALRHLCSLLNIHRTSHNQSQIERQSWDDYPERSEPWPRLDPILWCFGPCLQRRKCWGHVGWTSPSSHSGNDLAGTMHNEPCRNESWTMDSVPSKVRTRSKFLSQSHILIDISSDELKISDRVGCTSRYLHIQ